MRFTQANTSSTAAIPPEVERVRSHLAAFQVITVPPAVEDDFLADAMRQARVRVVTAAHAAADRQATRLWDELTAAIPTPEQITDLAISNVHVAELAAIVDRLVNRPVAATPTDPVHFNLPFGDLAAASNAASNTAPPAIPPSVQRWSDATRQFILSTCSMTKAPAVPPITPYQRELARYNEAGRRGDLPRSTDADLEAETAVNSYLARWGGHPMVYAQSFAGAAQSAAAGIEDPLILLGLIDQRLAVELPDLNTDYEHACMLVAAAVDRRIQLGLTG